MFNINEINEKNKDIITRIKNESFSTADYIEKNKEKLREMNEENLNNRFKNYDNRNYLLADFKFEKLQEQIKEFQDSLSDDLDVYVQLAAYGNQLIYVEDIGYQNPDLLYFYGYLNNNKVQLIQHTSQLNFLLIAVKKEDTSTKPNRIGFKVNEEDCNKDKHTGDLKENNE